jgi:hypothetical protein
VNLLSRHDRKAQSHEIARRLRPELDKIAAPFGARIKVAEVPPGPPVLQTLVAEVYGPDYKGQIELADQIKKVFQQTPGVVDVDWYVEDPQTKYDLKVDLDKAPCTAFPRRTSRIRCRSGSAARMPDCCTIPVPRGHPIEVRLSRPIVRAFKILPISSCRLLPGGQIALQEVTTLNQTTIDTSVYRKNLQPVVYVTGDVAGGEESPVYAIMKMSDAIDKIKLPDGYGVKQYKGTTMPERTDRFSMKWDGEWHITVEVFRDLGLAFAAVLVLDLRAGRGMVPLVRHAAGHHGADSADAGWHPPGARLDGRLLHRHFDDRIHRGSRHHRAQFDHPRGLHRTAPFARYGAGRGRRGCRRCALPPDAADRRRRSCGCECDPVRSDIPRARTVADGGEVASTVLSRMAVPVLYYMSERRNQTKPSAEESHPQEVQV